MTDPLQLVNTPAQSNFITRDYLTISLFLFSFHRENLRIIPADIPLVQIVISWCWSMSGPQPIRGRYAGSLTNQRLECRSSDQSEARSGCMSQLTAGSECRSAGHWLQTAVQCPSLSGLLLVTWGNPGSWLVTGEMSADYMTEATLVKDMQQTTDNPYFYLK